MSKAGLEGFLEAGLTQAVSLHCKARQVLGAVRAGAVTGCVRLMCLRMVSLNKGTRILRRGGIEQQFSRHPKCSLEKYALTAEESSPWGLSTVVSSRLSIGALRRQQGC